MTELTKTEPAISAPTPEKILSEEALDLQKEKQFWAGKKFLDNDLYREINFSKIRDEELGKEFSRIKLNKIKWIEDFIDTRQNLYLEWMPYVKSYSTTLDSGSREDFSSGTTFGTFNDLVEGTSQSQKDLLYEITMVEELDIPEKMKNLIKKAVVAGKIIHADAIKNLSSLELTREDFKVLERMSDFWEIGVYGKRELEIIKRKDEKYQYFSDENRYRELIKKTSQLRDDYGIQIGLSDLYLLFRKGDDKSLSIDEFLKRGFVFSEKAKDAHISLRAALEIYPADNGRRTLWGRERFGHLRDAVSYIAFGRGEGGGLYRGWEYVAAGMGFDEENYFKSGHEEEKAVLENAKTELKYVREQLSEFPNLKKRFEKVFSTLKEWRENDIAFENTLPDIDTTSGAYFKGDVGLECPIPKQNFSSDEYGSLQINLTKGFKAISNTGNKIEHGIHGLYQYMTTRKEDYEKAKPVLRYMESQDYRYETGESEKRTIEEARCKDFFDPLNIMEAVLSIPKGFYFSQPPLHGGRGGKDPIDWDSRSYALMDNVFYRTANDSGKEEFINVKEYHVELWEQKNNWSDDLKLRLYSFSGTPEPKKLGELGLAVEIERNGKKKFLTHQEVLSLLTKTKEFTLATLHVRDDPLFKIEETNQN
jgi:hypothetical protein